MYSGRLPPLLCGRQYHRPAAMMPLFSSSSPSGVATPQNPRSLHAAVRDDIRQQLGHFLVDPEFLGRRAKFVPAISIPSQHGIFSDLSRSSGGAPPPAGLDAGQAGQCQHGKRSRSGSRLGSRRSVAGNSPDWRLRAETADAAGPCSDQAMIAAPPILIEALRYRLEHRTVTHAQRQHCTGRTRATPSRLPAGRS